MVYVSPARCGQVVPTLTPGYVCNYSVNSLKSLLQCITALKGSGCGGKGARLTAKGLLSYSGASSFIKSLHDLEQVNFSGPQLPIM